MALVNGDGKKSLSLYSYLYLKEVYIDYGFSFCKYTQIFSDHSLYLNGSFSPFKHIYDLKKAIKRNDANGIDSCIFK